MNDQIRPLLIFLKLVFVFTLFLAQQTSSQFTWTRTYGGAANDEAFSSLQTRDGNYVVVGDSGYGISSVIIKYSKQGDVLWKKSLPSAERVYLNAAEDPAGNLYFNTASGLMKTNSTGITLWKRNYSAVIGFQCLKFVDNNKNLLCYGNNSLGKIDSAGRLLWYKNYQNIQYANTFVRTERLAQEIWHSDEVNNSTLRALIKRVRDKLGYPESIINLKNRGYKLTACAMDH